MSVGVLNGRVAQQCTVGKAHSPARAVRLSVPLPCSGTARRTREAWVQRKEGCGRDDAARFGERGRQSETPLCSAEATIPADKGEKEGRDRAERGVKE